MRKIILSVAVSLDGLIEGSNGEFDWCFTDQDYGMTEFLNRIDAIFYGRKSYELLMEMERQGYPNLFKAKKSYVFSNTLQTSFPDTELVSGDIIKFVRDLKQPPGGDIWLWGGASLTTSLMNADLVDELLLAVHPIVLGAGKALFSGLEKRNHFTLKSSQPHPSGLVMLAYEVKSQQ